jgi:hypothetical protein
MPILASDWAQLNPTNFVAAGTLASAATIAPVSFFTVLTGNVAVATITPPVTHGHTLCLQFAGTAGVLASGNILTAQASVVGIAMLLVYNPNTGKYIPVM